MLSTSRFGRELRIVAGWLGLTLCLGGAPEVNAGSLDIVVQSATAVPGTIGVLDVLLVNNSDSAVTVGSFRVDVLLSSTASVVFTAIDNGTFAPYLFSITGSAPPGFSANLLPTEAAGLDSAASGGQVVNPGDVWGLTEITFAVDADAAPGTVSVSLQVEPEFLPPPGGTGLADDRGNPIAGVNLVNGTITVVPEPAASTLLLISGVVVTAGGRFSRPGRAKKDVPVSRSR